MHRSIAAICVSLLIQSAFGQEALSLTNVTIKLIRHGGKGAFRIAATIENPNDFAVFDVHFNCDIRDRRGNSLISYASTVTDAIQAKEIRTFKRLDIGAWPDQGKAAFCSWHCATS
jgi:hypothetical protein